MPKKPNVRKLPDRERRESLSNYLQVLADHPDLDHFRNFVKRAPERQLSLFAALERAAYLGNSATAPPAHDDLPDQLLCDVLDAIDRDPRVSGYGSAYGPDRHRINLQALGVWTGQPHAIDLFTTATSHLTANRTTIYPSLDPIYSPPAQITAPDGDLIAPDIANSQAISDIPAGIIHQAASTTGDKVVVGCISAANSTISAETPIDLTVPSRPLRRGRPPLIDDLAKGRLLGLISLGLSFRQAAAQLGVHHATILKLLQRDEEFAQQVAEARLDAISQPLLSVVKASRTNWRAAAWLATFLDRRRTSSYESTPEERELARKRA